MKQKGKKGGGGGGGSLIIRAGNLVSLYSCFLTHTRYLQ